MRSRLLLPQIHIRNASSKGIPRTILMGPSPNARSRTSSELLFFPSRASASSTHWLATLSPSGGPCGEDANEDGPIGIEHCGTIIAPIGDSASGRSRVTLNFFFEKSSSMRSLREAAIERSRQYFSSRLNSCVNVSSLVKEILDSTLMLPFCDLSAIMAS